MIEGFTQTIEKEIKEQRGAFFGFSLGALDANSLEDLLSEKGVIRAGNGIKIINF